MNRAVHLSEEAENDLNSAYMWYEDRLKGLGDDLLDEFRAEMRLLAQRPQSFKAVHRNFHHLPLKRFPFVIIYTFDEQTIQVYRLFHTSRNPSSWTG
jgi:toxin ParE1/3/4